MVRKKRCGVGAVCSAYIKYLHPSKEIKDKYPNTTAQSRLEGLLAVRRGQTKVKGREQTCIFFRHDDLPGTDVYSVQRWVKVTKEGAAEHFFEETQATQRVDQATDILQGDTEEREELCEEQMRPSTLSARKEDIANIRAMGLDVDDDDECLEENIPATSTDSDATISDEKWGWQGIDHRRQMNVCNVPPSMALMHDAALSVASYLTMFFLFFPRDFLEDILIAKTNEKLADPTSLGEFLRWIGVWLLLSSTSGNRRSDFWSMKPIDRVTGAPFRLNDIMSRARFDQILHAITYTNTKPPLFKDRFWEIRDMVDAWNHHMEENFVAGWMSCLDESMSIWNNMWTCPGWVFCPRKPHPIGNEYHSICCCTSGIMYAIEMVEGKDKPKQIPSHPTNKLGKTVGLLLRLSKSIHSSGKSMVLDSGFCILQGLVELRKVGVFAGALIKKRRYWPKHVRGDVIDEYFEGKDVGAVDSLRGTLDNVPYDIFCLKEPSYVMKIMSTYSGLNVVEHAKESKRVFKDSDGENRTVTFKYAEPFYNHYHYRHSVDDHNNLRHACPSIEETWQTHRWANRVFAFIISITETNTYLAFRFFVWKKKDVLFLLEFRKILAFAFINNEYYIRERHEHNTRKRKSVQEHNLLTAPKHAKKYIRGKWAKTAKAAYQQYTCQGLKCKKQVRTYCQCSAGDWLCVSCHVNHVVSQLNQ